MQIVHAMHEPSRFVNGPRGGRRYLVLVTQGTTSRFSHDEGVDNMVANTSVNTSSLCYPFL